MKTSISAIAALLVATSFAGSALAEGDYFDGTSKTQVSATVDNVNTSSIDQVRADNRRDSQPVFEKTTRDNR